MRENKKPNLSITWEKDRGKDVKSARGFKVFWCDRINGLRLSLAEKKVAHNI